MVITAMLHGGLWQMTMPTGFHAPLNDVGGDQVLSHSAASHSDANLSTVIQIPKAGMPVFGMRACTSSNVHSQLSLGRMTCGLLVKQTLSLEQ